jgi:LmbE family N-acetylglucosaminyl deacetylase
MPLAIAVSPHLDDAAFSCGGTLAALAAEGWEVVVATLFTASVPTPTGFALACQTDKGLPAQADYMAIRRAEDAEACRRLGARPVWLPFREAPHRGYGSPAALFGPLRSDDAAHLDLAAALEPLLARGHRPDLLLAPQAIGGHVDHLQAVRALHLLRPAAPVLWWQDFPYLARRDTHPARPFERTLAALPEEARPIRADAKRHACAAYATQLGFQFGGPEGLARALDEAGPREVFRRARTVAAAAAA